MELILSQYGLFSMVNGKTTKPTNEIVEKSPPPSLRPLASSFPNSVQDLDEREDEWRVPYDLHDVR